MREVICQRFCAYYQPWKDEAEKCLAFELLQAWSGWSPGVAAALRSMPGTSEVEVNLTASTDNDKSGAVGGRDETSGGEAGYAAVVCGHCAFRSHGCDFAAEVEGAAPCGGLGALASLRRDGKVSEEGVGAAWERFLASAYLRLAEHVLLRYLETPHLYDRQADELYEVNEEGFAWLNRCDGTRAGLAGEAEGKFLEVLLAESLIACSAAPAPRQLNWRKSPVPSLRYLELLLTDRCNLRCRHCYLEEGERELPLAAVVQTLREFQEMQGLRVLLSGGEPLLYSRWQELNERLPEFELRLVLLSNGLLLTDDLIGRLQVDEVQLSLDGMESGHDLIRGRGTWKQTVGRLEALQAAGREVSVATMIHRGNLGELERMRDWLDGLGILEWNLDIPCISGRLTGNQELWLAPEEGARYLDLGFGGSDHGGSEDFACGRHLAAVFPNGTVAKCGLFADRPLGRLEEGLETCWRRLHHFPLSELECANCEYIQECRGGCRFRAGGGLGPDPVMCARYGINQNNLRR